MASFTIPVGRTRADPDPTGPIRRLLHARVPAFVETESGAFTPIDYFVIDTGAGYITMSATLARARGIRFPAATSRLPMRTAVGFRSGRVHDGELWVRFPLLPDRVFRLCCVFSEEMPPGVPPLFGLNDFLEEFRLTFDGTPTTDAVFGSVRFDTRT